MTGSDWVPNEWCVIIDGRNLHGQTYEEWAAEFGFDLDDAEMPLDLYDDDERRELWRLGWDLETQQQYEAYLRFEHF